MGAAPADETPSSAAAASRPTKAPRLREEIAKLMRVNAELKYNLSDSCDAFAH